MTKIKLCGLKRPTDIEVVNVLKPEYIGFVFWPKSKRNVTKEEAKALKAMLDPSIQSVGVFVDKEIDEVVELLEDGMIDIAQLHGQEDEEYIRTLKERTGKIVFKAFTVRDAESVKEANASSADYVLVDSGKGTGMTFNWTFLREMTRPYFLAGGLGIENVSDAIETLHPYAVDVSSGIETDGVKDPEKMKHFVELVRNC